MNKIIKYCIVKFFRFSIKLILFFPCFILDLLFKIDKRDSNYIELLNVDELNLEKLDLKSKSSCLISFIIPVYNVEEYLEDCIKSIYIDDPSVEYIFVNDKSPDNSYIILNKFKSMINVKIINNLENVGLGASRNLGLMQASGEYIYFMDSDDFVNDNAVNTMLSIIKKYEFDVCQGLVERFYTGTKFRPSLGTKIYEYDYYNDSVEGYACGKLIKRDLFLDISFPIGIAFEDIIVKQVLLTKASKIMVTNFFSYAYRENLNSISFNFAKGKSSSDQYKSIRFLLLCVDKCNIEMHENAFKLLSRECTRMLINRTRCLSINQVGCLIDQLLLDSLVDTSLTYQPWYIRFLYKFKFIVVLRLIFR